MHYKYLEKGLIDCFMFYTHLFVVTGLMSYQGCPAKDTNIYIYITSKQFSTQWVNGFEDALSRPFVVTGEISCLVCPANRAPGYLSRKWTMKIMCVDDMGLWKYRYGCDGYARVRSPLSGDSWWAPFTKMV